MWQRERLGMTTHLLRWWDEAGQILLRDTEKVDQERQPNKNDKRERQRLLDYEGWG
ncbi:hypothetical protein [Acaryochloris sp. IP29b_bin.137]|uniref:hypothetical protein n=1 Tax=Acaryochloris sp. IP29b_bin.137 TaxID=2969217 RepID=UPI0026394E1C|nr:hypothetical protein [Acaryochloris sp. IP29b_bin.137]